MNDWQVERPTLKNRAVRSGFVQIGTQMLSFLLGIGAGILFARLLTPEDFGLLALANAFIFFVNMFRDMGLQKAAVHHPTLDDDALSALFWLNAKLSAAVLLFMVLMAWPIAVFYRDERLTALTLVLAVGVVVLNLAVQPESLLIRQMRFRRLSQIELLSMIVGIVVGLILAWNGFGYWALAGQVLAASFTRSAAIWLSAGWRPRVGAKSPKVRELLQFGGYHAGFRTLNYLSRNLDQMVLGRIGGVSGVGVYSNAFRWAHLPLQQFYVPLLNVAVSTFSRLQDDPQAYRRAARQVLLPLFSLTIPLFIFMALEAERIVPVLFGDKWLEAIPLFRLFALSALATGLVQVTNWLYLSTGQTKQQFRWSLIAAPALIIGILLGTPWGALGIAIGFTTTSWLLVYPALYVCLQRMSLTMRDFAGILWRPAFASLAAAILLFLSERFWQEVDLSPFLVLLAQGLLFGLIYLTAWLLPPGGWQSARSFIRLFRELWPQPKRKTENVA